MTTKLHAVVLALVLGGMLATAAAGSQASNAAPTIKTAFNKTLKTKIVVDAKGRTL